MGSHPDFRLFALPIMGTFVVAIIYCIVTLAQPKWVPFSNHPHEVNAVVPTATAQPAAAPTSAAPSGPTLTLVGENQLVDKQTLTASAGSVTISFENKDNGTPHNVHVFKGTDASGTDVGSTDVAAGPITQTLTLTLTAGTYFYHCDVHPTTMTGTLTVS